MTDIDFVGTFVPANITGHVRDHAGLPLSGIKVTSVGGFPEGSTFTDSNGFYSFPNVQRNRTYSIFPDHLTAYDFQPNAVVLGNLQESQVVNFVGTRRNTVQFTTPAPSIVEGSSHSLQMDVTRTGDVVSTATVKYTTTDTAGLANCAVVNGKASERCDYQTTVGTLRFAAGETTKSFSIPIINDTLVEGNETFTVNLTSPSGAMLGSPATATVTIVDNDSNPPGPIPSTTQNSLSACSTSTSWAVRLIRMD